MKRVLILCTGNSCRSQMAEVIWNALGEGQWQAVSAGAAPSGYVHPLAIQAMGLIGLPTNDLISKSTDEFAGQSFDLVVTVCDNALESCPYWPEATDKQHWPFFDPADATGTDDEKLEVFCKVRDQIQSRICSYLVVERALQNPEMQSDCEQLIDMALREDLGDRPGLDATTESVIPIDSSGAASFVCRVDGTVSGLTVCRKVADRFESLEFQSLVPDGTQVESGQSIAILSGSASDILKAERTCLNFLGRLSGIATLTSRFVEATYGTRARVYDTRKTLPGWRRLEKYAVACGGGWNHRMGLFDAVLIKDNHLAMIRQSESKDSAVAIAIQRARKWVSDQSSNLPHGSKTIVQIEVDHLDQLKIALGCQPDIVLLDNMSVDQLVQAVAMRDASAAKVELEASGGITLETIRTIAQTGVERISSGSLTHSAVNLDIGLDWST